MTMLYHENGSHPIFGEAGQAAGRTFQDDPEEKEAPGQKESGCAVSFSDPGPFPRRERNYGACTVEVVTVRLSVTPPMVAVTVTTA